MTLSLTSELKWHYQNFNALCKELDQSVWENPKNLTSQKPVCVKKSYNWVLSQGKTFILEVAMIRIKTQLYPKRSLVINSYPPFEEGIKAILELFGSKTSTHGQIFGTIYLNGQSRKRKTMPFKNFYFKHLKMNLLCKELKTNALLRRRIKSIFLANLALFYDRCKALSECECNHRTAFGYGSNQNNLGYIFFFRIKDQLKLKEGRLHFNYKLSVIAKSADNTLFFILLEVIKRNASLLHAFSNFNINGTIVPLCD